MAKRITIEKNEGIAEVVEKIIDAEEDDLTVVVPKGAAIGGSAANFHLLKREADSANKAVAVESVDEKILSLAKANDLAATHPFFEEETSSGPALSDIVPAQAVSRAEAVATPAKRKKKAAAEESRVSLKIEPEVPLVRPAAREEPRQSMITAQAVSVVKRIPWRKVAMGVVALGAIAVVLWLVGILFGRATITINFKKIPWSYENNIVADTSVVKADVAKNILPAELFSDSKNLTQFFPAFGAKSISLKATGKITIYNAYSSQPQGLVATTRFMTPDGKIFRITSSVVVPGAKIKDNKIIPASIDAAVVADQAGPGYNVGPVARLTIPGFKGSPKYDGFYGELKEAVAGGFIGQKAVPTADDMQKAKDKTSEILRTTLQASFLAGYPKDFKVFDGASDVNITKLNINENTNAEKKFSVFGEATVKALGFRESNLKSFLAALAAKDNPNTVFEILDLGYSDIKPDFGRKTLSFRLLAKGVLKPAFSADDFAKKILGQNAVTVRSLVGGLDGLSGAKVSLWPIWLGSVPDNPGRVKIVLN